MALLILRIEREIKKFQRFARAVAAWDRDSDEMRASETLVNSQPSAPDASRPSRPFRREGPFVTVPGGPVLALVRGGGVSQPFQDVRKRPFAHVEVR